jgi:hypothetical protein
MSPEGGLPLSAPGSLGMQFRGFCHHDLLYLQASLEFFEADRVKGLLDLCPVQFLRFRENSLPCREDVFSSLHELLRSWQYLTHRLSLFYRQGELLNRSGGISPARNPGPLMPTGLAAPPICFLVTLPYKPELPLFFFIV